MDSITNLQGTSKVGQEFENECRRATIQSSRDDSKMSSDWKIL